MILEILFGGVGWIVLARDGGRVVLVTPLRTSSIKCGEFFD